jgi:alpha-glucosidase (family GH31 glycosyl hydrolase)
MLEHGYAIGEPDGNAYRNKGWWFTDALVVDVTDPAACTWWFDKRRYLFDELGIDGMKTDGGEHLWGRDLVAHDGSRGTELVNTFAQRYVDAYHDFVRDATDGDGITFSRAGYTGAQRSPAHWAGDENSTWSGLKASILAGLSAGLAGVSLWGFDIGGFSGEVPTVELYLRSTAIACFSPIMQFHSELHQASESRDRTPWNIAERHGDARALDVYRAYAKLRMRLIAYVEGEAAALASQGRPLMRMPALEYPGEHDRLRDDPYAYLFGRDLLVCPVLEKGASAREVLLPVGDWVDLWSGARLPGGRTVVVPAPLERVPVFVRGDSPRLDILRAAASGFGG